MEIWFECTISGQRCAAEVGEGCSAADLQERAVAVLYPHSVVSAEAMGLCVDDADGEVLAPEVLIAHTALCAGGTVYVRKQDVRKHARNQDADSGGVWVPKRYTEECCVADVYGDTIVMSGKRDVTINLVTTKVTPFLPTGPMSKIVLLPHHIVYCSGLGGVVHFRPRDDSAEVVVHMEWEILMLVPMRVTEAVLIGASQEIVQYSCEGVRMRTIDHLGYSFAVSPCETLFLSNTNPTIGVYRLDTPELCLVHDVDTGLGRSFVLQPSFSPDASLAVLSCGSNHTVRTIDIASGKALCTLPNGEDPVKGACFSACSRYLFTVVHRNLQQWDARSGTLMGRTEVDYAWALHASKDGRRLVVVGLTIPVLDTADIDFISMQASEQDALQPAPRQKQTVVATESRCGCVCS